MKKIFTLLALLVTFVGGVSADEAVLYWPNGMTGANSITVNDFTIAITGNTSKNWSNGNGDITYNGTTYKTLKNSNGAQNTVTCPEGYVATKCVFYVTTNDASTAGKLSEFNGAACSDEVSSMKDYANPTVIEKTLDNADSFTFTFSSKQVCFIAIVTYKLAAAIDPVFSLSSTSVAMGETAQINVGSKTGLDGLTMSNLTYDDAIINIDATGKITPVAQGTSTITFTTAATESYNEGSANLSITVTAPVVEKPTFSPNGAYFTTSKEVTITSATEGATILYSTDNGATWNTYTEALTFTETTKLLAKATKEGYTESEIASADFNKITALDDPVSISEATTWDWSKYGTKEIGTEGTEFYRSEILVSNVEKYGFTAPASTFGPANALTLKGDYIVRDSKYCQITDAIFTTTVPGYITVVFSNTGNRSNESENRYLCVNGANTGVGSYLSRETVTAENIPVSAGEVHLTAIINGENNFIRIYSIVFTPATSQTITPAKEYTTLTSAFALDFTDTGLSAYIVKEEDVTSSSVKLTQVNKVPAGTGLVLKGTAGTEYSIPVLSGDADNVEGNKLVGDAIATTAIEANAGYILKDGKFYPSEAGTLAVGKAYLAVAVPTTGAKDLNIVFGEGTGINNVNVNENESGKIFNLSGQQMKSALKGVYIKNGKKYIK